MRISLIFSFLISVFSSFNESFIEMFKSLLKSANSSNSSLFKYVVMPNNVGFQNLLDFPYYQVNLNIRFPYFLLACFYSILIANAIAYSDVCDNEILNVDFLSFFILMYGEPSLLFKTSISLY